VSGQLHALPLLKEAPIPTG